MKFFVYPYRYECDNAIMLKNRLGGMRIKLEDSSYQMKDDHVIVNWGNSKCPYSGSRVINQPAAVEQAVHKLRAFDLLRSNYIPTVPTTTRKEIADIWLQRGDKVIGRQLLKSNNGKGIVWYDGNNGEGIKFYSRFIPSTGEFRVNVYRGRLISSRIKAKLPNMPDNDIKSGLNGYVFRPLPPQLEAQVGEQIGMLASQAILALDLDFGGVDILYSPTYGPLVIEVNTAPELQGAAMDRLANYIKQDYQ